MLIWPFSSRTTTTGPGTIPVIEYSAVIHSGVGVNVTFPAAGSPWMSSHVPMTCEVPNSGGRGTGQYYLRGPVLSVQKNNKERA